MNFLLTVFVESPVSLVDKNQVDLRLVLNKTILLWDPKPSNAGIQSHRGGSWVWLWTVLLFTVCSALPPSFPSCKVDCKWYPYVFFGQWNVNKVKDVTCWQRLLRVGTCFAIPFSFSHGERKCVLK